MLTSCLLHLVATSYFLFVEILGANVSLAYSVKSIYRFSIERFLLASSIHSDSFRLTNKPDGENPSPAIHRLAAMPPFGIEGPILLNVAVPVAVLPSDPVAADR